MFIPARTEIYFCKTYKLFVSAKTMLLMVIFGGPKITILFSGLNHLGRFLLSNRLNQFFSYLFLLQIKNKKYLAILALLSTMNRP
ncbi:hypothetical protein BFG06_20565 [Aeromonas caviae]|nr:hypothetical protein BFG06_20565 [Aeromonas caviae]